jgi:MFS family permease
MAVFYLTSMVISGFSNIIGYGMQLLSGRGGLLGWQWSESFSHVATAPCHHRRGCSADDAVFLLFGVITVALAIAAAFLIVDFPEKSSFLTPEQKAWAIERIQIDRGDAIPDKLTMASFTRAISDLKIWAFAYLFMTATTGAYACTPRLPTPNIERS